MFLIIFSNRRWILSTRLHGFSTNSYGFLTFKKKQRNKEKRKNKEKTESKGQKKKEKKKWKEEELNFFLEKKERKTKERRKTERRKTEENERGNEDKHRMRTNRKDSIFSLEKDLELSFTVFDEFRSTRLDMIYDSSLLSMVAGLSPQSQWYKKHKK